MSASISNSNSEIAVTNNLGFGILLDDNTVSTSLQMYMLREHAKMLAFRSIGHQFSTEIVDQVAMVLYELSKQRIVNRSNLSFEISAEEWDLLQGLNVPCSERWRALRDRMVGPMPFRNCTSSAASTDRCRIHSACG